MDQNPIMLTPERMKYMGTNNPRIITELSAVARVSRSMASCAKTSMTLSNPAMTSSTVVNPVKPGAIPRKTRPARPPPTSTGDDDDSAVELLGGHGVDSSAVGPRGR